MQTINLETKRKLIKKARLRDVKQILLIDDEKNSILSTAFAQEGYDVIQCDSVRKAWCLVCPHRPHLIILYLDSSKSTALADLQECLALAEGVPTILVTSAPASETLMKNPRYRPSAFLTLPLAPRTIRKMVSDLEAFH
jgi:DNA-binding NtrC family response regulator